MGRRWPIHEGRPVSPYERGYTIPLIGDFSLRGQVTIHHGVWPWRDYRDNPVSRTYASLLCNTFPMIAVEHNQGRYNLHKDFDPPKFPPLGLQAEIVDEFLAINGFIECIYHKQTRETYVLPEEQWQNMRKGV